MERLIGRGYILAAILAVGGAWARVSAGSAKPAKTEAWMESDSVANFGKYHMVSGDSPDPRVSYKMDHGTYEELGAYGIVARVLSDGDKAFDVVLIASQAKASFHDPRVCFTAQGWQFENEEAVMVPTKTRGLVPVTVAHIRSDMGDRWAAFCYRGPNGFASSTNVLKYGMFVYSIIHSQGSDGIFYRFIAQQDKTSRKQLVDFIGQYLDACARFGNGYF